MVAPGFALGALAFSEQCSTNWATRPLRIIKTNYIFLISYKEKKKKK